MIEIPVLFGVLDEKMPLDFDDSDDLRLALNDVNVVDTYRMQSKTTAPSTEEQTIKPDKGFDGLTEVVVEPMLLQEKDVAPTTEEQTVEPDSGFDGLSRVTVSAVEIPADATAVPGDILEGKTAYVNGEKITGTIPIRGFDGLSYDAPIFWVEAGYYPEKIGHSVLISGGDPPHIDIKVDGNGWVTATVDLLEAYYLKETFSRKWRLPYWPERTLTPGVRDQTIEPGVYLTGVQTIKGDPNLVPENIKRGVSIFGVVGTADSGGITDVWIESMGDAEDVIGITDVRIEDMGEAADAVGISDVWIEEVA